MVALPQKKIFLTITADTFSISDETKENINKYILFNVKMRSQS